MASSVTDDIAYRLLGCSVPESEGRWEVTVWTGSESDAGTKDSVLMVLYGTTGHTEPKTLNKDFAFNPGSVVKLQVTSLCGLAVFSSSFHSLYFWGKCLSLPCEFLSPTLRSFGWGC